MANSIVHSWLARGEFVGVGNRFIATQTTGTVHCRTIHFALLDRPAHSMSSTTASQSLRPIVARGRGHGDHRAASPKAPGRIRRSVSATSQTPDPCQTKVSSQFPSPNPGEIGPRLTVYEITIGDPGGGPPLAFRLGLVCESSARVTAWPLLTARTAVWNEEGPLHSDFGPAGWPSDGHSRRQHALGRWASWTRGAEDATTGRLKFTRFCSLCNPRR